MDPEETVSVEPSESTMVETPEETPSEPTPDTETPAEPVEAVEPTAPIEPELYELPDGRKVDGETLAKEWKQNFLPDYTKKSQALAEIERSKLPTNETPQKPYQDPEWAPQTYAELIEIAKQEIKADQQSEQAALQERQQQIETEVVTQLNEIKTADPSLNENALFQHATKYGFRDLKLAHQNMKDMSETIKTVQKTTATNIAKRNDPVSATPGAIGQRPDPSQFESAVDYLRAIKNAG